MLLEAVKVRSDELLVECGGVTEFGAICLFVCVDPQLNNSLEELNINWNRLTDEFTADDNFIHLSKLKKLDLANELFSEAGFAAISLMIQVHFSSLPSCDCSSLLSPFTFKLL